MAVPIVMPKLGMVMSEGTVARWTHSAGDPVSQGEVIAEIETEKINYDLEATEGGIFQPVVAGGALVPVDGVLGYLLAEGEPLPKASAATAAPPVEAASRLAPSAEPRSSPMVRPAPVEGRAEVRSTPGARKVAAKLGVDIAQVAPSGPGGRVVESDVRAYAEQAAERPPRPPGLPEPSKAVPLEGMRKAIADHMRSSLADTAQLTFHIDVDVTEAQRLRRGAASGDGGPITLANVITKACAEALRRHPEHNAMLRDGEVLFFDDVNIGIAVALKEGLIVPVVKQAEKKGLLEISQETEELVEKARDGTLLPDEVSGGTFTISVLGVVDGFTPILNAGQAAILGVGRTSERPVVRKGEVVVREMATMSLTVDHQVVDGALAAGFLRRLQQLIERPSVLFKKAANSTIPTTETVLRPTILGSPRAALRRPRVV